MTLLAFIGVFFMGCMLGFSLACLIAANRSTMTPEERAYEDDDQAASFGRVL